MNLRGAPTAPLRGTYGAKTGKHLVCQTFWFVEFGDSSARVEVYERIKGRYLRHEPDTVVWTDTVKSPYRTSYRGRHCDVFFPNSSVYLSLNTTYGAELVRLHRGAIPDSEIDFIRSRSVDLREWVKEVHNAANK
jgi:hypothetical protein